MRRLCILLGLLLLASPAWAFPDNGVLETFTAADGTTPPNANWTNAALASGTLRSLVIQDNAASTSNANLDGSAYWDTTSFGAACEAYATIVDIASNVSGYLYCRLANIGVGTTDGYAVKWTDAASTIEIIRVDNNATTTLGSAITQTIAAGDKYGIRTVGDQICAWYKVGAGAWTRLACRTDATYSSGGFIGMTSNGSTTVGAQDDFGGGTVTSGSPGSRPIFLGE